MSWDILTSQGNEQEKIRNRVARYLNGQGVDLGCGPWKVQAIHKTIFNSCIGVDLVDSDVIADLGKMDVFADERFDYVFSSHALEDFFYTEPVLKEWWRLVKPSGYLILYLPLTRRVAKEMGREDWEKFYPNIGEEGCNFNHKQDLNPEEIKQMMGRIGLCRLVEDEIRVEGNEYSFLHVYEKLASNTAKLTGLEIKPRPAKTAAIVRYGAIGDMIQASPVFRLVKEQGYHVTLYTTPTGADVVKHNPYIDEIALQLTDVVPNHQLNTYMAQLEKQYDLFINLSGSVEDNLLIPDRKFFLARDIILKSTPEANENPAALYNSVVKQFRREIGEKKVTNYYDAHLEKAGLAERGLNGELYFSPEEEMVARDFRERHKGLFLILWSLSGSAYHKLYPYFQQVVEKVLGEIPNSVLISVGDYMCIPMECAVSDFLVINPKNRKMVSRYYPRAYGGDGGAGWRVRHSLMMTKYMDLVVGSETGILNAAGCFKTPKITLLSHSSHDNLCKYWENDYCLAPDDTFCHPCHMLHYHHPVGKQKCLVCDTYHNINAPDNSEREWSCPYTPDLTATATEEGQLYPLCMARGFHPDRVVARIREVYERWKDAKTIHSVPIADTNAVHCTD